MNNYKINFSELPALLEVTGKYGDKKSYIVQGSKKKFGVCLQALDKKMEKLLIENHDQRNQ